MEWVLYPHIPLLEFSKYLLKKNSGHPLRSTITMTELLERVIAQLKALPAEEQDAIASGFLAEMEDERIWKAQFESTTDNKWDRMAEMIRKEIADGDITSLAPAI
jgi:hypothetical protein